MRTTPSAEQLRARFGTPDRADLAKVLKLLGREGEYFDRDTAFAYRYPSVEAHDAFAEGNRVHHGHTSLGPAITDDGVYGITVLNPKSLL